jgi:2-polyprenyl-3-methyl-5-hydroxy-6-metoxy-1,4-benzoquinol methylase
MELPLPDRLAELWTSIEAKQRDVDDYERLKNRWLDEHKQIWREALMLPGQTSLKPSLLTEIGQYDHTSDLAEVERRCRNAGKELTKEWDATVNEADRTSVESFYNQSKAEIYGLLWWHTLEDDLTPLSYVLAMKFAVNCGARTYLDFGSGVGSGAVLFHHAGLETTCADISAPMLNFCRFRFKLRNWSGEFIDLKQACLPKEQYDFITALDVFEHLYDPIDAAERLCRALRPGGHIMGRWAIEEDDDRRGHIVKDLRPTIERMKEMGMTEVWRDDWLWGHRIFRKP